MNGVLHATGDTACTVVEARRVLELGGRAMISQFYRKPSWMYALHRPGRENIEHKDRAPPQRLSDRVGSGNTHMTVYKGGANGT